MVRQLKVLIWKSCRDIWPVAVIAMTAFMLPPLIFVAFMLRQPAGGHAVDEMFSGFVMTLGGVVAVLLGMALTCDDMSEPRLTFWRSRAIGLRRFLAVKFGVGLFALLVITLTPLVAESLLQYWIQLDDVSRMVNSHLAKALNGAGVCWSWAQTPLFILLYSTAFTLGCLIRRATPTAMIAAAAAGMVYLLPFMAPALEFLSIFSWYEKLPVEFLRPPRPETHIVVLRSFGGPYEALANVRPGYPMYVLSMLSLSAVVFLFALRAVRRDWVWRVDQRATFWAFGGAALLVFWFVAGQLGVDMEPEKVVRPKVRHDYRTQFVITSLHLREGKGVAACLMSNPETAEPHLAVIDAMAEDGPLLTGLLDFGEQKESLQISRCAGPSDHRTPRAVVSSFQSDRAYTLLHNRTPRHSRILRSEIATVDLTKATGPQPIESALVSLVNFHGQETSLRTISPVDRRAREGDAYRDYAPMAILGSSLFVIDWERHPARLLHFSLSDPDRPRLVKAIEHRAPMPDIRQSDEDDREYWEATFAGPVELSARSSFDLAAQVSDARWPTWLREGDLLVLKAGPGRPVEVGSINAFRLLGFEPWDHDLTYPSADLKYWRARLERLDSAQPSHMARMTGTRPIQSILRAGFFYDLIGSGTRDRVLYVYDLRDPADIRRVGHYVTPEDTLQTMAVLPDGRILAAGEKLHYLPAVGGGER